MGLRGIRSGAVERGPVLVTLACALASVSILAFGPGSLTSHADAGSAATTTTPAARIQTVGAGSGSTWWAPDTIGAIERATGAGVDGIEFEVRFTPGDRSVVLTEAATGNGASLDEALEQISARTTHVYLDVTAVDSPERAHRISDMIATHRMTDRVTAIAADRQILDWMQAAGTRDLGLVFADAAGWAAPYRVLAVPASELSADRIAQAHRSGHFVIVVQDHPNEVTASHPDAILADWADPQASSRQS